MFQVTTVENNGLLVEESFKVEVEEPRPKWQKTSWPRQGKAKDQTTWPESKWRYVVTIYENLFKSYKEQKEVLIIITMTHYLLKE